VTSTNFWGELIKKLREEQKLTQRMLATQAKVSRTTLRRIETGASSAEVELLERLLRTLGYELEALETTEKHDRMLDWELGANTADGRARTAKRRLRLLPVGLLTQR
jgi:transcriptional regulator with XRE-family HTH domain